MKIKKLFGQFTLTMAAAAALASGATWTEVDAGLTRSPAAIGRVVVDPSTPSTVYAVGGSLFKSTNGAETWELLGGISSVTAVAVAPNDSSVLYALARGTVVKSSDGGHGWVATGFTEISATALLIDPQHSSTLYAVSKDGIFKTTDAGATWALKTTGLPRPFVGGHLAIDPTDPSTIYSTGKGLHKSTDGGETWRELVSTPDFCNCPVAIDPAQPSTVYAVLFTPDAPSARRNILRLSKSTDGGETWSPIDAGIPGVVTDLVIDRNSAIYASYVAGDPTGGIVHSADGGASWTSVNAGLPPNTPPIRSLALGPADASTIFAAYYDLSTGRGGVFKTADSGGNWKDSSAGLEIVDVHALAIDPGNPSTMYAAAGDGVSKTVDSGAEWRTVRFPGPGRGKAVVPSVLIDPNNPKVLYASVEDATGCVYTDHYLRKSTDGGTPWSDLPPTYCVLGATISLAMDAMESNTVYAAPEDVADCGTPVDTTTDGGQTWKQNYIDGFVAALVIEPGNPATLYAGTSWWPRGVLKSTDGGRTWSNVGLADLDVSVLAIDPVNAKVLYAGTSAAYPDGTPGIFESTDGAATWADSNTGLETIIRMRNAITSIVVDGKRSAVYLGTAGGGIFRSVDGGATWSPLNDGLPSLDIRALAIRTDGSGTLYAATPAGVFRVVDEQ